MWTCISTAQARTKCVSAFWAQSGPRHFSRKFLYNAARVKCRRAFRLRRLPQSVCAPVFWAQSGPEHFSSKIRIKFPKQCVRDLVPRHCIEILLQRSCQEVSCINLAKRAFIESWYRDLTKRSCQEISYRDLVQEVLPRDLLQRFVQRSCMRSLTGILPTELL